MKKDSKREEVKEKMEAKERVVAKSSKTMTVNATNGLDKLKSVLEQRRKERQQEDAEDTPATPPPVSLGPAGAIVDALINTSPEKLLELTDFDRNQVSLIPQVVVIDDMWDYLEQVLLYRMDKGYFFKIFKHKVPDHPDTSGKFIHVLAQTRRSLGGKMKKALEDMALAELETKSMDDTGGVGGRDFED